MITELNQLRYTELNPELAAKLWPFINAYHPHDQPPTWQDLRASGLEKIEEDSLLDIIEDQHLAERETEEVA